MIDEVKPAKILILGSGGLRVGQAGEFDYSGTQAIKALKSEGIKTILVNPNIATVQTDGSFADRLYLLPLALDTVAKVIERERPDAILLSFGGQTALNLGLELEEKGVLRAHGVRVLGTSTASIRLTEDRELFKEALAQIDAPTPKSIAASTVSDALKAAKRIGYPVMLRAGFSLGGLGSGRIETARELEVRAQEALSSSPQILIEEYLAGWKELEYEIVRDAQGNALAICTMENMDPMGIHTGESIVVAPIQTLNNREVQMLRTTALRIAHHVGIVGECNVQFALHPETAEFRVIEMNARLSRSSALASKATGYPLAYIAAKLALGHLLSAIPNAVTKRTCAFFEPALDYIAVKIPKWDTHKLRAADRRIGSEMKSVGEVMAIGRSFPEALQKAVRMLHIGARGITDYPHRIPHPEKEMREATDRRLFALVQFFKEKGSLRRAQALSGIHPWFLRQIQEIVREERALKQSTLSRSSLLKAKQCGFSDGVLAKIKKCTEADIRARRVELGVLPVVKQIDTLAGEFDAETNYLYMTYHGSENDVVGKSAPIAILGSGPYSIGSSVEFDWCAVNASLAFRALGKKTLMINSNPETVSTDYDASDRLYFEELTLERVSDILDFEEPEGVVVSFGGQIANTLALLLEQRGYPLLGTAGSSIDGAENRERFSALLQSLHIDQPPWQTVTSLKSAKAFAKEKGYPLLVRPSYVLSGSAMNIISSDEELERFLREATRVTPEHPVVLSQFITEAKELELDGVAHRGEILIDAISEHIENAGVHSGDATLVLPPQKLYLETVRRTKLIARAIVKALAITGPFNIQFIAKNNALQVIECNVRAARSFPFVSKVTGHNLVEIAVHAMLGKATKKAFETLQLEHVGVKAPQFSYNRLKGASPVAHVEMASTGEVACLGSDFSEAFFLSWFATEQKLKGKNLLISIGGGKKSKLLDELKEMHAQGWNLFATRGTHAFLAEHGVPSKRIYKIREKNEPNVKTLIEQRKVDLVINIPQGQGLQSETEGFRLRRLSIDHHIPLVTNLQFAAAFLQGVSHFDITAVPIRSWQEWMGKIRYVFTGGRGSGRFDD